MATDVDICNLALAHLGDAANVQSLTPPASIQAQHCKRFYPIARDAVLARHAWAFNTCRIALSELSGVDVPDAWGFAYGLPDRCLTVLSVYPAGTEDDSTVYEFTTETLHDGTPAIFTDVEEAYARYTVRVENPGVFPPLVVNAIARLLASHLAGPLIKGSTGAKVAGEQLKMFEQYEMPLARTHDARQEKRSTYRDFTPTNLAARQ